MTTYKTSEVAAMIGVHPNTVRLYEQWGLIPKPERQPNGYRIFTDWHVEQIRIVRLAFRVEVVQNGLRKIIIQAVKTAALGDFDKAMELAEEYLVKIRQERQNAETAVTFVNQALSGNVQDGARFMLRKEVSRHLGISTDAIRNWEMNGLLTVKRQENGYRIYSDGDVRRLQIIRSLRCANYSLAAILRMLNQLSHNPDADIRKALDTPKPDDDIVMVCDKLITSLTEAENDTLQILALLEEMKRRF